MKLPRRCARCHRLTLDAPLCRKCWRLRLAIDPAIPAGDWLPVKTLLRAPGRRRMLGSRLVAAWPALNAIRKAA